MRHTDDATEFQLDENLSTAQLVEIVHIGPPDYGERAVAAAETLLRSRQVTPEERQRIITSNVARRTKRLNCFWRVLIAFSGLLLFPHIVVVFSESIRARRPAAYDDIWDSLRPSLLLIVYGLLSGLAIRAVQKYDVLPAHMNEAFITVVGVLGVLTLILAVNMFFALFED